MGWEVRVDFFLVFIFIYFFANHRRWRRDCTTKKLGVCYFYYFRGSGVRVPVAGFLIVRVATGTGIPKSRIFGGEVGSTLPVVGVVFLVFLLLLVLQCPLVCSI